MLDSSLLVVVHSRGVRGVGLGADSAAVVLQIIRLMLQFIRQKKPADILMSRHSPKVRNAPSSETRGVLQFTKMNKMNKG